MIGEWCGVRTRDVDKQHVDFSQMELIDRGCVVSAHYYCINCSTCSNGHHARIYLHLVLFGPEEFQQVTNTRCH